LGDREAALALLDSTAANSEKIAAIDDRIQTNYKIGKLLAEMGLAEKAISLAERLHLLTVQPVNDGSRLSGLGSTAVLWSKLKKPAKIDAVVNEIRELLQRNKIKTSGLGIYVNEIAAAGETAPALILARLIREPETRSAALCAVAGA
jgi:hypothetical protein